MNIMNVAPPLHKHPQPHTELFRRHRHYWTQKSFRVSAVFSVLIFIASMFIQMYAVNFAVERRSGAIPDLILSNTPVLDIGLLFVNGMFLLVVFIVLLCLAHPKRIPFTLYSLALLAITRALFVSLTHVSPFQIEGVSGLGTVITGVFFGADLFSLGYTGVPFLMALLCWREKILRYTFLVWSLFSGAIVLIGHVHYSAEVLLSFFITYGVFRIAESMFSREQALFHLETSEDVPWIAEPVIRDPIERRIFRIFEVAVVLKGLNAILEIALGVLLMFTNVVNDIVAALVSNELIEDPNDFLATHIQAFLSPSPHAQFVGALYLLGHGVVKVFLMAGLLRNKLWAYPSTIVVLTLLIVYQLTRFSWTHSPWLIVLSAFDTLVVWLVWHEYKRASRARS